MGKAVKSGPMNQKSETPVCLLALEPTIMWETHDSALFHAWNLVVNEYTFRSLTMGED